MIEITDDNVITATSHDEGFVIDNDQKAEWAMQKIREANVEKERWTEFYNGQLKKVCDREDDRIKFMMMKLAEFFRTVPHKVSKTQESYQLPSGKLVMKAQQLEYERDEAALLNWCMQNNQDYVKSRIVNTVDWNEMKKKFTVLGDRLVDPETGVIVDGVTVTERPDVFKVEVK